MFILYFQTDDVYRQISNICVSDSFEKLQQYLIHLPSIEIFEQNWEHNSYVYTGRFRGYELAIIKEIVTI